MGNMGLLQMVPFTIGQCSSFLCFESFVLDCLLAYINRGHPIFFVAAIHIRDVSFFKKIFLPTQHLVSLRSEGLDLGD